MSKRAIKRIIIAVSLIVLVTFAYGFFESRESDIEAAYYYWISDVGPEPNPNLLRYYPENRTGYYQFDPRTFFASLDQGKTDLFSPLSVDPNTLDVFYDEISWTQSDFLRVANTLSQQIWNEPLDLNRWGVYNIIFSGGCTDNFGGFNNFDITYYKTIRTGWETFYTARHIVLIPSIGVAEWGGDGDFSTFFIFGWKNIELTKFKTTAEQAVRIAEENGGKAARLKNKNKCNVYVNMDENVNRTSKGNWLVDYSTAQFFVFINPFTGDVIPAK